MCNIRLARPDDEFVRAIGQITSKKNRQTDDDRLEVDRLSFCGGLYMGDAGPIMPTANLRKCFIQAARVRRLGKSVERGLIPLGMSVPLDYPGPRTAEELWDDPQFRYSTVVTVGRAKVPRMRPHFPKWNLNAEWELLTDTLDLDDLVAIVQAAGLIEGLGDNRVNGFGRFEVEVTRA